MEGGARWALFSGISFLSHMSLRQHAPIRQRLQKVHRGLYGRFSLLYVYLKLHNLTKKIGDFVIDWDFAVPGAGCWVDFQWSVAS